MGSGAAMLHVLTGGPRWSEEVGGGEVMDENLRQLLADWLDAAGTKEAARIASMVREDCVFLTPGAPPIRGRQAVEQMYRSLFARCSIDQKFHFEEFRTIGDWAFGWGTDQISMTPTGGGETARFAGHGLSILQRGFDGRRRFARGINNAVRQTA